MLWVRSGWREWDERFGAGESLRPKLLAEEVLVRIESRTSDMWAEAQAADLLVDIDEVTVAVTLVPGVAPPLWILWMRDGSTSEPIILRIAFDESVLGEGPSRGGEEFDEEW